MLLMVVLVILSCGEVRVSMMEEFAVRGENEGESLRG